MTITIKANDSTTALLNMYEKYFHGIPQEKSMVQQFAESILPSDIGLAHYDLFSYLKHIFDAEKKIELDQLKPIEILDHLPEKSHFIYHEALQQIFSLLQSYQIHADSKNPWLFQTEGDHCPPESIDYRYLATALILNKLNEIAIAEDINIRIDQCQKLLSFITECINHDFIQKTKQNCDATQQLASLLDRLITLLTNELEELTAHRNSAEITNLKSQLNLDDLIQSLNHYILSISITSTDLMPVDFIAQLSKKGIHELSFLKFLERKNLNQLSVDHIEIGNSYYLPLKNEAQYNFVIRFFLSPVSTYQTLEKYHAADNPLTERKILDQLNKVAPKLTEKTLSKVGIFHLLGELSTNSHEHLKKLADIINLKNKLYAFTYYITTLNSLLNKSSTPANIVASTDCGLLLVYLRHELATLKSLLRSFDDFIYHRVFADRKIKLHNDLETQDISFKHLEANYQNRKYRELISQLNHAINTINRTLAPIPAFIGDTVADSATLNTGLINVLKAPDHFMPQHEFVATPTHENNNQSSDKTKKVEQTENIDHAFLGKSLLAIQQACETVNKSNVLLNKRNKFLTQKLNKFEAMAKKLDRQNEILKKRNVANRFFTNCTNSIQNKQFELFETCTKRLNKLINYNIDNPESAYLQYQLNSLLSQKLAARALTQEDVELIDKIISLQKNLAELMKGITDYTLRYIDYNKLYCKSSIIHRHGVTGQNNAADHLSYWINKERSIILKKFNFNIDVAHFNAESLLKAYRAAFKFIIQRNMLNIDELPGNIHRHSYKTFLLAYNSNLLDLYKNASLQQEITATSSFRLDYFNSIEISKEDMETIYARNLPQLSRL